MSYLKNIITIAIISIVIIFAVNILSVHSDTIITGKVVSIADGSMVLTLRKMHKISEPKPRNLLQDLFLKKK